LVQTTHLLMLDCEVVGCKPPPPLCACVFTSWGDLYYSLIFFVTID